MLLGQRKKTEQSLFEELYHTYSASMYRVAFSILRDNGLAEGAVQQTFLKIFREIDKIDEIGSNKTRSFIVILVRNTSIDLYRKRKRENLVYFDDLEQVPRDRTGSPEDAVIAQQSEEEIRRRLESMDPKYADILMLRYYHGCRNKEIARLLELSEATVASRIFQGKKMLLRQLEGGEAHGE